MQSSLRLQMVHHNLQKCYWNTFYLYYNSQMSILIPLKNYFNRYKYNLKISIPKKLVFYPFTVRHRLSPSPSINAHHRKNGQKLVINGDGTKS